MRFRISSPLPFAKLSFDANESPADSIRPWQTRTHCCRHVVADTNVSPFARARNIVADTHFVSGTQKLLLILFRTEHFVSVTNVSPFAQPNKHHEQQCVLVCQGLYGWIDLSNQLNHRPLALLARGASTASSSGEAISVTKTED